MSDPKLIAVVPQPEWREVLLGDGPCGSRAPYVFEENGIWLGGRPASPRPLGVALVLMREGQPVPDGIARVARALGVDRMETVGSLVLYEPLLSEIQDIAERCMDAGIASEVIIEVADNG